VASIATPAASVVMADSFPQRRGAIADSSQLGAKSSSTVSKQGTGSPSINRRKAGDGDRKRTSATLAKVQNDAGSSSVAHDGDTEDEHAKDAQNQHPAPCRAPTREKLAQRQSAQPTTKLIQSLTSKWSRFTEAMVVKLIESGEEDVHSKLLEPWDAAYVEYGQTVGATALHFAARRGLLEVINSLIGHAAPVNGATDTGATPIMVAAMFNQVEAAKVLFQAKASVLTKDDNGFCAMDIAILEGKKDVIAAVEEMEVEEEHQRELAVMVGADVVEDWGRDSDSDPEDETLLEDQEAIAGKRGVTPMQSMARGRTRDLKDQDRAFEWTATDEAKDQDGSHSPESMQRRPSTIHKLMHSRTPGVLGHTAGSSPREAGTSPREKRLEGDTSPSSARSSVNPEEQMPDVSATSP